MKLEAKVDGENVIISKGSFKYLLDSYKEVKRITKPDSKIWDGVSKQIDKFHEECEKLIR
jgi:hypothetical protein